jgi:hypothetical protein|nr:MAG TPA: tail assembly chaperone protein [Caudoviricetes sp.]
MSKDIKELKNNVEVIDSEVIDMYTLSFKKPYLFEGQEYSLVNLSGLKDITARDMIEGQKHLAKSGEFTATPELSLEYICFIAARVSGLPIEFFKGLPARYALALKNKIMGFFYGED